MDKDLQEIVKRLYALVQRQGALLGAVASLLTHNNILKGSDLRANEQHMQALLAEINQLASTPGTPTDVLREKTSALDAYVYGDD
jgi:hypothetical protein